jgi:hypothetical protein
MVYAGRAYATCVDPVTWAQAAVLCLAEGMKLAQIDSAAENTELSVSVEILTSGTQRYWLGGNDLAVQDSWRWALSTQFWQGGAAGAAVDGAFTAWSAGEPSQAAEADCLAGKTGNGQWEALDCTGTYLWLCEDY